MDKEATDRLKLPLVEKEWGSSVEDVDARLVEVRDMQVGGVAEAPHLAVAEDLTKLRNKLGVDVVAVLGGIFFRQWPFTIDFRSDTLTILDEGKFKPPASAIEEELRLADGTPMIPGVLSGSSHGWFELDPGQYLPVQLSSAYVIMHPEVFLSAQQPRLGSLDDGVLISRFRSLDVLRRREDNIEGAWPWPSGSPKYVADDHVIASGTLGATFCRDMRMTFDYQRKRLWIEHLPRESDDALVARLINPRMKDLDGMPAITRALLISRADVVAKLLKTHEDVNSQDPSGDTPVMWASQQGDLGTVELLLRNGARTDLKNHVGRTALMLAAVAGRAQLIGALLAARADVNSQDESGLTALHLAAWGDHADVASLLLKSGADPRIRDRNGLTPLLQAAAVGSATIVHLLLEVGVSPNEDTVGVTALMYASKSSSAEAVRLLVKAGANVNAKSPDGQTPLMHAADSLWAEGVRTLLGSGADASVEVNGNSALAIAFSRGRMRNAQLLYAASHKARRSYNQKSWMTGG